MRFRSKLLSSAVVVAFVLSACTGGSDPDATGPATTAASEQESGRTADPTTGPTEGEESEGAGPSGAGSAAGEPTSDGTASGSPDAPADDALAGIEPVIAIASSDGSAFGGSRAVFTLTNMATGAERTVAVDGDDADTLATVTVEPGTYRVTAEDQYVGPTSSYRVRDVTPAEVTVAEGTDPSVPSATVTFGLQVQQSPFDLRIDSAGATEIALVWELLGGAEATDYQLRRTDGSLAATGPQGGTAVTLSDPAATAVTVEDLAPATEYTFTLFATGADGSALASRSVTSTTPPADGSAPSYALAPNTIVPTDFAALQAQALGNSRVAITLTPENDERVSATVIPGVDPATVSGGCVVGLPVLVSTEVAADQAFFGVVESCGSTPPAWKAVAEEPVTAVVNTDVPLAAVIPYLAFRNAQQHDCIDTSGTKLASDAALCAGVDSDGDGMKDTAEQALGRESEDPTDGWSAFLDEAKPRTVAPAVPEIPVEELEPPAGLGSGEVQVTLLWSTGDDLDLSVVEPAGADSPGEEISYRQPVAASGATLDVDDQGDASCQSTRTRAENVFWKDNAPTGEYAVTVVNFRADATCASPVQARLEVRVDGNLVVEKVLTVGVDGPVTFTVSPPGWRSPEPVQAGQSQAGQGTAALPKIECEGTKDFTFDPGFGVGQFHDVDFSLKYGSLRWDIKAGVTAHVDPSLELEAGVECALEMDGITFQLVTVPVPINLEIAPVVEGSVTGTIELRGPRLELTFGVKTTGSVDARLHKCGWFRIPCGIDLDAGAKAEPIGSFTHGPASLTVTGELKLGVGVEATLGVGIKNAFVTAKTGLAFKMKPIVGTATASVTVSVGGPTPTSTTPAAPGAGPVTTSVVGGPPYSEAQLIEVFAKQANMPAFFGTAEANGKPVPAVGPTSFGSCTAGGDPFGLWIYKSGLAYSRCSGAICLDGGGMKRIFSDYDSCAQARCVVGGDVMDTGRRSDLIAECPQGPLTTIRSAAAAVSNSGGGGGGGGGINLNPEVTACAEVKLGAELEVDLRAEAFVLGWGEDKRYPIWSGEFDYPNASFDIGTCD